MQRRLSSLVVSGIALALSTAWLIGGLFHPWAHPVVGWLPLPVTAILAGRACWAVSRRPDLDPSTRRFWRHLTIACALFTAGIVANAADATAGAAPSQRVGPVALVFYLGVLVLVMWSLLRLPSWHRSRSDWIRFGIDACVVLITVAAFVWRFSLRDHHTWERQTGSAGGMLAIALLTTLSMVTFMKVAFAGAGRLDRRSTYVLAVGAAVSATVGSMSPFLIDKPYLSSSLVAVPIAAVAIHLAAVRQWRAGDTPARNRRRGRRISVVPYFAVAVTDGMLLTTSTRSPGETRFMQAIVVALTFLAIGRQIIALRDNNRLMATVESHREELTRQATHDSLTGVANRALLEQRTRELLDEGGDFHVLLLDLDDFKVVNDRLGHQVGDRLIVETSRRLTDLVGDLGTVGRLGGDEFAVVLAAVGDDLLDQLVTELGRPADLAGNILATAVSIGVTRSRAGDDPDELLRRADVAMYSAKAAGGDRWQWFDPAMDRAADESARLSGELRQALERGEIFALFQPITDLSTGRPVGAEVLMRWQHPERGLVPPDVFIPLAERNGAILGLGRWVLEFACRQAADWQRRLGDAAPEKISVNVSARQLAEPGFVATVREILAETGADPARLLIEVTETAVLNTGSAAEQLTALRELGLRVALDDFGTGHSSLSLLLDLPVDVLKVDKSFVSGAAADHAGAIVVRNLIGFTDDFGIEAVAEGVETEAQAARLRAAGYHFAQGYLFGRPMPAGEFEKLYSPAKVA
ncbi:EAL domain-containing protein [Actinoplanes sp. NPDC026619]|uniref:putative bifunctional diguanylate cyclase/phosphodiesterase n=1 Tax=Actinoplanes sp. NPDC026619 TaxID=3155798 RepID=UPI0033F8B2EC